MTLKLLTVSTKGDIYINKYRQCCGITDVLSLTGGPEEVVIAYE